MQGSLVFIPAFATMVYLYSILVMALYYAFMMPQSVADLFPDAVVLYNIHRPATVAIQKLPAWASDSLLLAVFSLSHSFFALDATKSFMNLPKVHGLHLCVVFPVLLALSTGA